MVPLFFIVQGSISVLYCFSRADKVVPFIYLIHGFALFQVYLMCTTYPGPDKMPLPIADRYARAHMHHRYVRSHTGGNSIMVIRCVQPLLSVEQLDVPMLHFVLNALVVAVRRWEHGSDVFPLSSSMLLFFVINVPVALTSTRGAVVARLTKRGSSLVYLIAGLPLVFIFACFSLPNARFARTARTFTGLVLFVGAAILFALDQKRTCEVAKQTPTTQAAKPKPWYVSLAWLKRWMACLARIGLADAILYSLAPPAVRILVYPLRIPLHGLTSLMLVTNDLFYAADALIMLGVTMITLPASEPVSLHASQTALFSISGLLVLSGRKDAKRVVQIDSDAENFISHAIKQKFVGSGTAILHAIDIGKTSTGEVQQLLMPLLAEAYKESQFGYDLCLFVSVARKIYDKSYAPALHSQSAQDVVRIWRTRVPPAVMIELDEPDPSPPLEAAWELIWILVAKLSMYRGTQSSNIKVGAWHVAGNDYEIVVALHPVRLTANHDRYTSIVLAHLRTSFDGTGAMRIPAKLSLAAKQPKVAIGGLGGAGVSASGAAVPPGLSVAILDDNLLSRRLLWRFVKNQLQCSPESFATGDALCEAESFVRNVLRQAPDVCVLDQHLDYNDADKGEVSLLGNELAWELRKGGYTGCLLLHTANEQVLDALDLCFDGGITKSLSAAKLHEGFVRAWITSRRRLQGAGTNAFV